MFPFIVHEKQDRVGVSETDQEEMSLLSTWDYNADEFHILVRECFLLEKKRKKSLDSDPVIEKQTKTQFNACQNSFFRWLYFCFCVVCACVCVCVHARMHTRAHKKDSLAHFSALGLAFTPRWPDLASTSSFKTAAVSKAVDPHHICTSAT